MNYFDRLLISVNGPSIKDEFALSDTQYGLMTGLAFVALYASVTAILGWLADRWPRHAVMAWSLGIWSAATIFCGAASSYVGLLFGRAGVGVGEAGFIPASFSFLSDKFKPTCRAFAFGVLNTVGLAGILGSFVAGGWIAAHYGWRRSFMLAGIPGLALAILVYVLIPDRSVASTRSASLGAGDTIRYLSRNRTYLWLICGGGIGTFANIGIIQWLPLFFRRSHHLSLPQISMFFGPLLTIGMVLGAAAGGYWANRLARQSLSRPLLISIWANIAIPPVFWATLLIPIPAIAMGLTFVTGCLAVSHVPIYAAAIQNCCQAPVRGSASGGMVVMNSVVGMGLLPFLVGVLSDAGAAIFGENSLRYALAAVISGNFVAAYGFVRAYRTMLTRETDAS